MNSITMLKKSGKVHCRVAGCTAPIFKTPRGEVTHYHRVHSGLIAVTNQVKNRVPLADLAPAPKPNGNGHVEPVKTKRSYTKRKIHQTRQPRQTQPPQSIHVNFCPICGTDLLAVAAGLLLKGIRKTVVGCPCCLTDLRGVAVGLAMNNQQK